MAEINLIEAVNLALAWELKHDEDVVLIGEDIGVNGGVFRATEGLQQRFGEDRVVDTPLAGSVIAGMAVGMAAHGPMEPLRGVRNAMARNMAQAHAEVAPATLVEDADISQIESAADITPRLIRALIAGCKAEPSLNAWYDSHANGRRVLQRIHLGLAVDAPQGLFVAVMTDIQNDNETALKRRLSEMKVKISERQLKPADLRGYSIILSNYGAIAGRYASPVVLPPTVAILGAGKSRDEVVVRNGDMVIRHMLPLALTFDHRAVTGGEAARFLKAVIIDLEQ
ncbi:MAG: 2-oxoisovalerate dehydrogenase E2 component (dihydrolipoyl transacylase) [Gammaproteobacteria bacterium]|jgi:2-oxoisovalerate dehydrogenase E2 component (dihydrolipoyl transacylase)